MASGKPKLLSKTPDSDETSVFADEKVDAHERIIRAYLDPKKSNRHPIIGYISAEDVTILRDGTRTARIFITHLELPTGEFAERHEELLLDIYTDRTGATALPGDDSASQLDMTGLDGK